MTTNSRQADHPIDPIFLERWSPRAFTAEPISEPDLMTILEAARWALSSYNSRSRCLSHQPLPMRSALAFVTGNLIDDVSLGVARD